MIKKLKSICRNKILSIVKEANKAIQSNVEQTNLLCKSISNSICDARNQIQQNQELCKNISKSLGDIQNQMQQNKEFCENISKSLCDIQNQIQQNKKLCDNSINSLDCLKKFSGEMATDIYSIFSYCVNQTLCNQTDITNTDMYKYYKLLHKLTSWNKLLDNNIKKQRVGKDNDGGYVMIKPFSSTKIAYSFGICNDVSWDKDMANIGYQIYQYDHTIEKLPENNHNFHWEKIGLTGLNETDNLKTLNTLLIKNGHENTSGMVLKIDIEGAEWDFLNFCDQRILDQFDQIILELHDLNNLKNAEYKLSGLQKLTTHHIVVHIHGNNYSYTNFCGDMTTPNVLELTLVKRDNFLKKDINDIFLESVDMVNRPNTPDVLIGKW